MSLKDDTPRSRTADWAIIAIAAAMLLLFGSTLADLRRSSKALATVEQEQTAALEVSGRVERQLDALATGTRELAAQGNENARAVIATLQQNGIQISAPAAPAG